MLTVGDIFTRERKRLKLSLDDVAKMTRVRKQFLEALEHNDWDVFESKIYIHGAIKSYAGALNLDQEKMIAYFRRDYEKKEVVRFKERVSAKHFRPETRKIILAGVAFIFTIFLSYFIYQLHLFLSPPEVEIVSPQESITRKEKITVVGQTEKDAAITIFGDTVYQDENGQFTYDFALKEGRNELVIEVIGANGKETIFTREFIREE